MLRCDGSNTKKKNHTEGKKIKIIAIKNKLFLLNFFSFKSVVDAKCEAYFIVFVSTFFERNF